MNRLYLSLFLITFIFLTGGLSAQIGESLKGGEIHGNFQWDSQYYKEDTLIGAKEVPEQYLSNGFANLNYTNGNFAAGVRYESYLNAMQGFPNGYKGNGFPYRYAGYKANDFDIKVGNFYEQFGNGLILRAYEERGLGYDNAFDGIRVGFNPYKGIYIKGILGKQRLYFDYSKGIVRGGDLEINVNELCDSLSNSKVRLILGSSVVSKYQQDQNSTLTLPENVMAWSSRANVMIGSKININAEYAYKFNDPSSDNGFIYKPGHAALLLASYSQKGFGASIGVKRVDNMSFRSERERGLQEVLINYIPSLNRQHTYNLLATLYPYAVQLNGEMGYQAEIVKKIKKDTPLGGKYGTGILINYSFVNNIDTSIISSGDDLYMGYESEPFILGKDAYFRDLNIEISKKFSKNIKGIFTYANLVYNKDVLQGKTGYGLINTHISIADVTIKLAKKHAIRTELQHMAVGKDSDGKPQDMGNWATALIEYTFAPHWYVAVMDQYNYGNKNEEKRVHYYFVSSGYIKDANRIMLSYGRQREGIFCVGGVCRNVPAANGVTLTITSSF